MPVPARLDKHCRVVACHVDHVHVPGMSQKQKWVMDEGVCFFYRRRRHVGIFRCRRVVFCVAHAAYAIPTMPRGHMDHASHGVTQHHMYAVLVSKPLIGGGLQDCRFTLLPGACVQAATSEKKEA